MAGGRARARDRGGARGVRCGRRPGRRPEITVEVNPGESDEAHLRALRGHGVNRLSIGVQAFDDRLLRGLGRNHDAAAGPACVRAARAAGFDNVSIDLMFGVPEQSFDDWRRAVDLAIGLAPDHVSAYALTVERGTAFGSLARAGRLARPDDEAVAAMFEHARAAFAAAGLEPYEISSYARRRIDGRATTVSTGRSARTWGSGASAASFRPLADGSAWRFSDPRATDVYLRDGRPGTSSGEPPPIWRTRRSGSGYAPPPGSTAPLIAPVMVSTPSSVVISKSSAPSPPAG